VRLRLLLPNSEREGLKNDSSPGWSAQNAGQPFSGVDGE
jgi:hypothetical protein